MAITESKKKSNTRSYKRWTTADELRFIDNLGKYTLTATTRAELLKKYANAIAFRHDWVDIDKAIVVNKISAVLKNLNTKEITNE